MCAFRIVTSSALEPDEGAAVDRLAAGLAAECDGEPTYLMLQMNAAYDVDDVAAKLADRFPNSVLHAATSCTGAMTQTGYVSGPDGGGLALFAIYDATGAYGTAYSPLGDDAAAAAENALDAALNDAGRAGQVPGLIWVTASPGREEAVIDGIKSVVGAEVPIIGGSSADNDLSGQWRQFSHRESGRAGEPGLVVSALFPSVRLGTAFRNAYTPTKHKATITKAAGRVILELDGRPARDVYDGWLGGRFADMSRSETSNILFHTALAPLGRKCGSIGGASVHILSHPETFTPEGGLSLFTDIRELDEVILMRGTEDMLVGRAGSAVTASLRYGEIDQGAVAGAIIVYCAGCMLTIRDRMDEVCANIGSALGGKPFVGAFTFGEQGRIVAGQNCHGNLMISAVVFEGCVNDE